MTTKFWTIKDNQIGTAHIGRDGKIKDFREGCIDWFTSDRKQLRIKPDNGVVCSDGSFEIVERISGSDSSWNWKFSEFLPVVAIKIKVGEQEFILDLPEYYWHKSNDTSPFTVEQHELFKKQLKEREEQSKLEYQQRKEKLSENANLFKRQFKSTIFSKQEQRWLNRFAQLNKAGAEVEGFLTKKFPETFRAFREFSGFESVKELILGKITND